MRPHDILSWFELFNWPLTPAEIPDSRFSAKGGSASGGQIPDSWMFEGFICPPGREHMTAVRRQKARLAWRKLKKARRWARVLRCVPFIRMIAIGNSLGYGNCSEESDIDLVIVTAPRRVWTVRLLVVLVLRLFRQRPGEHTRDAICPSFFLTTEAMNLEPLQIPPLGARGGEGELASDRNPSQPPLTPRGGAPERSFPPDPYLLFWSTQLTVLSDEAGTYEAFWRANAEWVRRWLPDARPRAIHPRFSISPPLSEGEREGVRMQTHGWSGRIGDALERWSRQYQEHRLSSDVRALANTDSRVIVNDRMLKFHTNDRRAEFRNRWLSRLAHQRVT